MRRHTPPGPITHDVRTLPFQAPGSYNVPGRQPGLTVLQDHLLQPGRLPRVNDEQSGVAAERIEEQLIEATVRCPTDSDRSSNDPFQDVSFIFVPDLSQAVLRSSARCAGP